MNELKKLNKVNGKNQENTVKAFQSIAKLLQDNKKGNFAKSTGGQLLATAAQFIPGVGQVISPMISMADAQRDNSIEVAKQEDLRKGLLNKNTINTNIYGNMEKGGHINSGFKQYNTGSHDSGMDQSVDANGNPSGNVAAKIQNKENSFKINGKPFVMSDTLVNPETGNTFNIDAAKVNKKWKNADQVTEEKNALNFEMNRLAKSNQSMINIKDSLEKAMGGSVNNPANIQQQPSNNNKNLLLKGLGFAAAIATPLIANQVMKNKNKQPAVNPINPSDLLLTHNNMSVPNDNINGAPLITEAFKQLGQNDGVGMAKYGGTIKKHAKGDFIEPPTPKTNSIFDLGLTVDNNTDFIDSVPPSDNLWMTSEKVKPENKSPLAPIGKLKLDPIKAIQTVEHPNPVLTPNPEMTLEGIQERVLNRSTTPTSKPFNYDALAVGLKGLALGRSIYEGTRPYKNETLIKPDYTKSDRQMYKQNFDYSQAKQAALSAANMGSNVNRSASSNFNQYQNRQGQNFGNLADNLSNINQQENNQNIGLNLQRGQYEGNKAIDTANRRYQNRIDNMQNLANRDFATSKMFSDLSQVGSSFNDYQYYKDMVANKQEIANAKINEGLMLIGSKYSNFGFKEDFIERLKTGTASLDEQIQFLSTIETKAKTKKEDGN